jgi:putative nucleotidyltransferase with HDIG domain
MLHGRMEPARVDECVAAALLHDVGKVALQRARDDYPERILRDARTPEERLEAERRELGIDHAELGAELARRWRLPDETADAIASHHDGGRDDDGVLVRVADMLTHYGHDRPVDLDQLINASGRAGIDRETLSSLMYELPHPLAIRRGREQSPLSERELEVLRLLATGMTAKQVAQALALSPSTVRNHLHRIYTRIGASDRTHAVLIATEKGWI